MTIKFDRESWSNHFEYSRLPMSEFAGALAPCLGDGVHNVVDETGLKGIYQLAFDCPLPRPPARVSTGADGTLLPDQEDGSLLTRSLDALGLKLDKRKMPMDVYVMDHVERPSQN